MDRPHRPYWIASPLEQIDSEGGGCLVDQVGPDLVRGDAEAIFAQPAEGAHIFKTHTQADLRDRKVNKDIRPIGHAQMLQGRGRIAMGIGFDPVGEDRD